MLRGGKEANEEIDYDFPDNQKAGYMVWIFFLIELGGGSGYTKDCSSPNSIR